MNQPSELIKILKQEPQWLTISYAEWTYLPWALFNCFGSITPESNSTIKALQALMNEDPKILVLSANPKKYYTNNLMNLLIEGFEGRESDSIIRQIQQLNNWSSQTEISLGRLRPIYGSLNEFLEHYHSILAKFNPSHVIIDGKINIDTEFDSREIKVYSEQDLKNFYQGIKDRNGINQVKKFITEPHFLAIPSNQLAERNFLFSYMLLNNTNFSCRVEINISRENNASMTVEYVVPKQFLNHQPVGKFKVICNHLGLLKLT